MRVGVGVRVGVGGWGWFRCSSSACGSVSVSSGSFLPARSARSVALSPGSLREMSRLK